MGWSVTSLASKVGGNADVLGERQAQVLETAMVGALADLVLLDPLMTGHGQPVPGAGDSDIEQAPLVAIAALVAGSVETVPRQ